MSTRSYQSVERPHHRRDRPSAPGRRGRSRGRMRLAWLIVDLQVPGGRGPRSRPAASRPTPRAPGSVSSKSLTSKTRFRSGVANTPKLARCASPQAWTRSPVAGVPARSSAMITAEPRRNANGEASIRPYRTGTQIREPGAVVLLQHADGVRTAGSRAPASVAGPRDLLAQRPPGPPAVLGARLSGHMAPRGTGGVITWLRAASRPSCEPSAWPSGAGAPAPSAARRRRSARRRSGTP